MISKPVFGWKSILATGIAISFVVLASKTPYDKVESVFNHMIDTFSIKQIANKQ